MGKTLLINDKLVATRVEMRKRGVKFAEFKSEFDDMSWEELHDARSAVRKAARDYMDRIPDDATEEVVQDFDKHGAVLVDVIEDIEAEFDRRSKAGTKDPLPSRIPLPPQSGDDDENRDIDDFDDDYETSAFRDIGWRDTRGKKVRVFRPKQHMCRSESAGFSLGSALRAMVLGPRNEQERRALSEGTDSAGGYTVPTPLAEFYIDRLRAQSVAMQAGATTVEMTSDTLGIARLATDPTAAWRLENAEISASDPTFEKVTLNAKSLGSLVKVSRELLEDSINANAALENAFLQAMGLAVDAAILYGDGSGGAPTGIAATSGINEVDLGTDGDAIEMDDLIDAHYELKLDNVPDPTAMIWHPRTGRDIAKLKDGDGIYMPMPEIISRIPKKLSTTSIPIDETQGSADDASSLLMGYFPDLIIGIRNTLRIEVLKERYAEYLQYGFVAFLRMDVQLAHKASFCRIKGIIPPA